MSYDLKVVFYGMNLFVRDGTEELHVLMPATGGLEGDECCVERHAPRLIFDTAHLRSGSTAADGVLAHFSLQGKKLAFPEDGSALVNTLPAQLAQLDSPVRSDVLSGENVDLISARVSLRNGELSDYARGCCWVWRGELQRMSHVIEWTVSGMTGSSLDLPLEGLDGDAAASVPTLYPVDGVIELDVWHAPHMELPPDCLVPPPPPPGGTAQHFASYGKVLTSRSSDMPVYSPTACPELLDPSIYDEGQKGASVYSCMAAEAPPV